VDCVVFSWKERGLSHFISFVRIPGLAIRQYVRPLAPLGVLDEDRLHMRVWPNDIDTNLHMNNGRYLNVMDYARTHLLARTRLLEHIIRSRWQPLVGAAWLTYRRSMPLFSTFCLASRLVCWDERWFYIEQTFTGRKGLIAVGWVKGILRNAQGSVDPQKVIEGVAPGVVSPAMPAAMAAWNRLTREVLAGG
jgi:acyl-CoA thioesterase FadM